MKFAFGRSSLLIRKGTLRIGQITIRALTDIGLWRFVLGDCNSSDIGTRKGGFVDLGIDVLFWNRPSFLLLDPSCSPKPKQSSSGVFHNI